MKIDNNRALVAEKKRYSQPAIQSFRINLVSTICVGSVQSNAGLQMGGGSNGSDPNQLPF